MNVGAEWMELSRIRRYDAILLAVVGATALNNEPVSSSHFVVGLFAMSVTVNHQTCTVDSTDLTLSITARENF